MFSPPPRPHAQAGHSEAAGAASLSLGLRAGGDGIAPRSGGHSEVQALRLSASGREREATASFCRHALRGAGRLPDEQRGRADDGNDGSDQSEEEGGHWPGTGEGTLKSQECRSLWPHAPIDFLPRAGPTPEVP